ncbi:UDP-N-acetylglucosamine--undecaprenyl-phosphate N-acetylglucosaminephosphotransferase [Vibrio harveyi]|uniref:UDP-N-acetylglucosamine--undecaprenyl-phosphate N-acetylglucosaminephosphotransferase n=1 Tax=Vibrio harveyi TaxID=669 RepID=UPI003BB7835E
MEFGLISLVLLTISVSFISLFTFRKLALAYDFVDRPSCRKKHIGDIPVVGGLSLFVTITFATIFEGQLLPNQQDFLACGLILTIIGTIDDKLDISASFRLYVIIAISAWLALGEGIALTELGNLFGFGEYNVGSAKVLLTTTAIIGCITAFNMVDGIDGLLASLASVTFLALGFMFYQAGEIKLTMFCFIFMLSMLPYILCNLELIPKRSFKVFMGDSGSFLIGFTIVWLLIHSSQSIFNEEQAILIKPVTALWLIAVPLMDMAMVMLRRLRKKQSPFKADRLHLHHICIRLGLSSRQTLVFITFWALLFAAFGILGQVFQVHEHVMLILFLLTFICYIFVISYIWHITYWIRMCFQIGKTHV